LNQSRCRPSGGLQYSKTRAREHVAGNGEILAGRPSGPSIGGLIFTELQAKTPHGAAPSWEGTNCSFSIQPPPRSVKNIYNLPFSKNTWLAVIVLATLLYVSSIVFSRHGAGVGPDRKWWSS